MKANQIVKRRTIYNGVFSISISWSILQLLSNLSLPPGTSHLFQGKYVGFLLVSFTFHLAGFPDNHLSCLTWDRVSFLHVSFKTWHLGLDLGLYMQ